MLCTACGVMDSPNMLVTGSDRLEVLLWGFLLVPGLLYCWWRHLHRRRVCPHCGSAALMRESRASHQRTRAPSRAEPAPDGQKRGQLVYAAPRIPWMATPSQRFRRVGRGGLVATVAGAVAFSLVSLNTVRIARDPQDLAALQNPRSEEDIQREYQARVQSLRHHECERLCAEFHEPQAPLHLKCMERCTAQRHADYDAAEVAQECANLLDPSSCEYISGRHPAAAGKRLVGEAQTPSSQQSASTR